MIRPHYIFLVLLAFSCKQTDKKPDQANPIAPKFIDILESDHDTLPNGKRLLDNLDSGMVHYYKEVVGSDTLKGGYITCYGIDDSTKYFYLRHGDTLHLLNQIPIYTSTWGLGTLEKDLDNFFITRIDNGNGVAETYQVFDKKTGNNLLGDNVEAWNFEYLNGILYFLYDNHTVNLIDNYYIDRKEADSIFLFNIETGDREGFKLPPQKPTDIIYYGIKKITKKSLTISSTEHYSGKEELVKYDR